MIRSALVTGSSSGIGEAIAKRLARNGYCVAVHYHENEDDARDVADYINRELRGKATVVGGYDVSNPDDAKALVDETVDAYGRLNVVVNNAGTTRDALLDDAEPRDLWRVVDVNLMGAMLVSKYALDELVDANAARVVNVSSIVASTGNLGQTAYAASKAGLEGFTRSLALELEGADATANAVAPGFVDTRMLDDVPDDVVDAIAGETTVGDLADPDDVASLVEYVASSDAEYVNGAVLEANAGHRLGVVSR